MLLVTAGRNGNDGEQAVGSIVLAVRSVLSDGPVVDVSGMRTVDCLHKGSVDRLSLLTDWDTFYLEVQCIRRRDMTYWAGRVTE